MTHKLVKNQEAFQVSKVGIDLSVFPALPEVGVVLGECSDGHNQEFYHVFVCICISSGRRRIRSL